MPNWADNRLIVSGEAPTLDAFLTAAAGETDEGDPLPLSFESLLPTPADLLDNGGWYDWRCEHWGVKWDVDVPIHVRATPGQVMFWFQSTWTGPVPLVRTLAERFPTLSFELAYADQEVVSAGVAVFRGGLCTFRDAVQMNEDKALELLRRHWPAEARSWQMPIEELNDEVPEWELAVGCNLIADEQGSEERLYGSGRSVLSE